MNRIELYSKIIHKIGFDLRRFPTRDQRMLIKYLDTQGVKDCFDIGANTGQFARLLRSIDFQGKIYSFEPQSKAFEQLSKSASGDSKWEVYNIGLGNCDGKSIINISKNSVSSSVLDIDRFLVETIPETEYISREEIKINRLDTFLKKINFKKRFFLKIDTQGFESKILEGAEGCFEEIYAIQLELACVSLYNGEKLFDEMKNLIESKGFYLSSVENGLTDLNNGRLLEVEAIFLREE